MSSVCGDSVPGRLMEDEEAAQGSSSSAAKKCRYCGAWSNTPCPWDLRGTCLSAWHPDIPWGRGKQGAAVGSICKPCQVVWDQGGFDAEGATEEQFARSIAENPSKLHEFLAVRAKMIKKKIANPAMRFRLEINGCTKEKIITGQHSETGLEAPETFFVELDAYEKRYGKADPDKVVFEEVEPGVCKAGVNVRTGMSGWHKRINKNYRSVNRTAQLNDEYIIDPNRDSLGLMQQAARRTVLKTGKDLKIAKDVGSMERMLCLGNGAGDELGSNADHVSFGPSVASSGQGTTAMIDSEEDDDDESAPVGMMEMLKGFSGHSMKEKQPKAKAKAKPLATPANSSTSAKRKAAEPAEAPVAPVAEPKAKAQSQRVDQVGIGRLGTTGKGRGKGNKRAKTKHADESSLCMDMDTTQEPFDFTAATSLCDADRAIMDQFDAKFKTLKDLSQCPLPDSAFKAFLLEKQTIISSLAAELKNKKKSAGRRALKEADPLFIAIGDVQEIMLSLQNLLKCLLGTAQIDAETSLLACIDEAMNNYGLEVNSSIMRRALKSLINDDFKLGAWNNLVSVSKKTIDERFLPADDGVSADDFYMLMCSQILQKMLRTATQKFKPKEKAASQANKTAMEGTEAFLVAIHDAPSSPEAMVVDSAHVINLLKAETARLDELPASLKLLEKLKKTPDQKLPLSQSFAVSNIGGRIMIDANEQLELRKATSGPLEENIQLIMDGKLGNENIDDMTKSLSSVHESWQNLTKEKKLPKEAMAAKLASITSASCKIIAAGWVLSAASWINGAIQSMTNGTFTEPDVSSWPMAKHLSHLEFYKPNQQLTDLLIELSKCTVAIKGGQDVLQTVQKHLSDFKTICNQLQGGIVQKISANDSELSESFVALMGKMSTLAEMIDKQKSNKILDLANNHLALMCNDMLALLNNKPDMNLDEMKKHCDQLSMHAASLQISNPRRDPMIQSAELSKSIFLTAHGLPTDPSTMSISTVGSIYESLKVLNEYNMEKIFDAAKLMTLGEQVVDPTTLTTYVTNLLTMATAQLDKWWIQKAEQLDKFTLAGIAMDAPDASSFSFPEDDDSCLTSSSVPMLLQVAANPDMETTTSGIDTTLKAMQAMSKYNPEFMKSKNEMVVHAGAIHHNLLSILAISCLVKTFTCKRFQRAVQGKTQPPKDLVAGLATTMKMAREVGLSIPPGLQARVGKFVVESKDAKDTKPK